MGKPNAGTYVGISIMNPPFRPQVCTVGDPNSAYVWVEPQNSDEYRQREIELQAVMDFS